MLFLLRKIRRKLISTDLPAGKAGNKFITYLLYAIGEIVLVMIGILLALQVSEWNETRRENKEEVRTLLSLKEDFLQSKINIDSTIGEQTQAVNRQAKLNKILIEDDRSIAPDSLAIYLYWGAYSYWKIEPTNGTYDALISSGKTDLLKNTELKRLLAAYSAEITFGFEDEAFSIDLTTLLLERSAAYAPVLGNNTLYQSYDYLTTNKRYSEKEVIQARDQLMDDRTFLGIMVMKTAMEQNRLTYEQSISDKLNKILALIDQELAIKNTY